MKKRFFIVFALISLCLALAAPVSAVEVEPIKEDIADNMFTSDFLIWDDAELLSNDQWNELNAFALDTTKKYQCDVRIVTVVDMEAADAYEYAKVIYRANNFGYGEEQSGVMLFLSTRDRDYALIAYGFGNVAFTDHGKDVMLGKYILPPLKNDDYYGAFRAYLNKSAEFLEMARAGTPFDFDTDEEYLAQQAKSDRAGKIALNIIIPVLIALIVCLVFRAQMKTARKQRAATNYIPEGGFVLTGSADTYLYSTEVRTPRSESRSSGGGTTVDSGGFSGSSGKY